MTLSNLLKEHFGITAKSITALEGYDSTNYKVAVPNATYVLKIYPNEPHQLAELIGENKVLSSLATISDYCFPEPIPTKNGKLLFTDEKHIYRLLSFVPGQFLGDVDHSPALLRSFGKFLARIDSCLLHVYAPAINTRELPWDLKYLELNYKFAKYIQDPKDRSLVDYFFLQFEMNVRPQQAALRKSIIHNDGNDWNVLVSDGNISGIIDFGDMCHSWLINELAIALTYIMMGKPEPLDVTVPLISAYNKELPLMENELDVLYYLIAARLCTSVCNSAYTKTLKPDSEYITISEKPAWDLLRKLLTINPIKAKDTFRAAAGFKPSSKSKLEAQLNRRNSTQSSALSLSYDTPIQMNRSAFQYMYDTDGNAILDAYNNIMITGHCHPTVVRAGQRTMARLNTNTRYLYEELLTYSEKLLSKFPPPLKKVFFVNSGSAATDLAIRLATAYTGKNKILALEHGYHGNTKIGIAISHYKYSHNKGVGQMPMTIATPMPKVFGSGHEDDGSAGAHYAALTGQTIEEHANSIAAFIAEPIVGCGGQVPLAKGYLKAIYPQIRAQGGVCISDEVQVGFGRLGDSFWGFEMQQVVPDIVVIGKPMGNGHPIGAVATTEAIAAKFEEGPEFFSSFGGNPVSCAIGEAVLDVIEEEDLQTQAKTVGNYLKQLLGQLQLEFPAIADIRGSGLFLGVELLDSDNAPNTKLAAKIKNGLRENNILISTDGPYDSVLKIKPPLCFSEKDAEILVSTMTSILRSLG